MKSILKYSLAVLIFIFSSAEVTFAQKNNTTKADPAEVAKLKAAVQKNPEDAKAHEAYIKALGADNPVVATQYEKWQQQFPKSATVAYALGAALTDIESPKARPYLLQAVKLNPKLDKAWSDLWIDAERWGEFEKGQQYLAKAVAAAPQNPDYAFYYAMSFQTKDPAQFLERINELTKRFPDSERGAQGLYWLASRSNAKADKLKWFEVLKNTYSPAKFNWSASGMSSYIDLLLQEDPSKALTVINELVALKVEGQNWTELSTAASQLISVNKLLSEKDGEAAMKLLSAIKLPRYFSTNKNLILQKAEATALVNGHAAGYDSLIKVYAKSPTVVLKKTITNYGTKLNKGADQINADIWAGLDAITAPATPFTLKNYLTPGSTSLSDYKGKVVLLTYWFPGCGPCRGEFPHFENVISKFKGQQVDYVGINIVADQDSYVVPFMKSSKYSFTPLADVEGRVKGNMDNRNAAPANFLIDQDGNLIFSNFRTDGDNEEDLELMISMILNRKKA